MMIIIIVIFSQSLFAQDNDDYENENIIEEEYVTEEEPPLKTSNSGAIYFEFGLGGSSLNQEIVTGKEGFGVGFFGAAGYHTGPRGWKSPRYHIGLAYLVQGFQSKRGANANEVVSFEQFQLIALRLGITPIRWLRLDVGYGLALFAHNEDLPNALSSNTTSRRYQASGRGYLVGGTIMPLHAGLVRFGIVCFYFNASSPSYSSDIVTNGAHAQVSEIKSDVHTSGYYTGLSMFVGL
ncbi:MAG: hypothetical protein SGI74_10630 [Oligoflexia bacterium]|nr:hypothetical protein [Oligoflexia bacterium]